jgi:cytochrome c biogenesis protein CcdA
VSDLPAAAPLAALWLGLLTSVSPCPLATNVVAVSFVARSHPARALFAATAYIVGRIAAYTALAGVLVAGLLSTPGASMLLQRWMTRLMGPLLVVVGMFLLDLLRLDVLSPSLGTERLRRRLGEGGPAGAALLGVLFALSFCPISAALFFGSLLPLSVQHGSRLLLPSLFGLGTGLPVAVMAIALAAGGQALAKSIQRIGSFESVARRATGVVFILTGVYLCLRDVLFA